MTMSRVGVGTGGMSEELRHYDVQFGRGVDGRRSVVIEPVYAELCEVWK